MKIGKYKITTSSYKHDKYLQLGLEYDFLFYKIKTIELFLLTHTFCIRFVKE